MSERLKEAAYYDVEQDAARCRLCPQTCRIMPGRTGICGTRRFRDGRLELLNYGRYTSIAVDPIEKKPLYHFHPGSEILSIGGKGCNLTCAFCQNCEISQGDPVTHAMAPAELAGLSAKYSERSVGVAFTYNEPLIWFEFIRDAAPLIRADGGKVVLVTNGFINPAPLAELLPLVDAMNIDLKSFDDVFYKKYCGGRIDPVKETITAAAAAGAHIEVTLLLIPEFNDSRDMLHDQARWISSVSRKIPLHISRYFPNHQFDIPATPPAEVEEACEIASEYLDYVYAGNLGHTAFADTKCQSCGRTVISRRGYHIDAAGLKEGSCANCGADAAVIVS